jgi:hypothetical protein
MLSQGMQTCPRACLRYTHHSCVTPWPDWHADCECHAHVQVSACTRTSRPARTNTHLAHKHASGKSFFVHPTCTVLRRRQVLTLHVFAQWCAHTQGWTAATWVCWLLRRWVCAWNRVRSSPNTFDCRRNQTRRYLTPIMTRRMTPRSRPMAAPSLLIPSRRFVVQSVSP